MAKFNFRLRNYLALREKLEDQKKLEYGKAVAQLEAEKQKKADMETEKAGVISTFREGVDKKIDPVSFRMYNDYLEVLKKRIKAQILVIIKAEEFAKLKRQELIKAMQDRKSIEILHDKAKEEHRIEELKLEQKTVDEVVTYRYAKKNADSEKLTRKES